MGGLNVLRASTQDFAMEWKNTKVASRLPASSCSINWKMGRLSSKFSESTTGLIIATKEQRRGGGIIVTLEQ
jgi:hypothetical protein